MLKKGYETELQRVSYVEGCPTEGDLYPPRKNWFSKVFRAKDVSEICIALVLISFFVGHGDLNREATTNDMMFCQTVHFFHFEENDTVVGNAHLK